MLNYIATQVSPPIISYAYLLDSYMPTQIHMQCHAYTYVVSVHVVSYAYSILCHSYVTYIVPYPAYLVSYAYLVSPQSIYAYLYIVFFVYIASYLYSFLCPPQCPCSVSCSTQHGLHTAVAVSHLLPHSQHCLFITPCLFTLRFLCSNNTLPSRLYQLNLWISQLIQI